MSDTNEALQNQVPQENAGYLMAYDKKDKKARGVTGIDARGQSDNGGSPKPEPRKIYKNRHAW